METINQNHTNCLAAITFADAMLMMTSSENHMEAIDRTQSMLLLTAKKHITIGYWNVRTLFQTDKTSKLLREMVNYKLDILGVDEVRWTGADKIFIKEEKMHIIDSCQNDDQHSEGVTIVMSKEAEKSLIQWEPISERLITTRF